jgi:hypothetical protein
MIPRSQLQLPAAAKVPGVGRREMRYGPSLSGPISKLPHGLQSRLSQIHQSALKIIDAHCQTGRPHLHNKARLRRQVRFTDLHFWSQAAT